jgi:hypothetical protein
MTYPVSDMLQAEFTEKLGQRDAVVMPQGLSDVSGLSLRDLAAEFLGEYEHGSVDLTYVTLPQLAEVLIDLVGYIVVVAEGHQL